MAYLAGMLSVLGRFKERAAFRPSLRFVAAMGELYALVHMRVNASVQKYMREESHYAK